MELRFCLRGSSHELKILPTMRLAHQFQNMKYVGILKSFCNKYKINSPQNTISVESQTENMQNDNTSVSDSEICQNSRTNGERNKRKSKYPKIKSKRIFLQKKISESVKKNQINSHQQKDLSSGEEKQQDSKEKKEQDSKNKKKRSYKSKKHGDKICPDILENNTRGEKRKSNGESDIPKKKRKTLSEKL